MIAICNEVRSSIKQASQTLEHLTSCKAPTHGVGDINKFSKFEQNSATQHWHYVSTQWNGWTIPPSNHRPRSLPPHRRHGIELSLKATALRDSEGWDPLCTPTAACRHCRPPGCPPMPLSGKLKKKNRLMALFSWFWVNFTSIPCFG